MKILKVTCSILTIIFVLLSCDDKSSDPNGNNADLIPLEVGNKWVYELNDFNDSSEALIDTLINEIKYKEDINNETFYYMSVDSDTPASFRYINRKQGLWVSWNFSQDNEKQIVKYPIKLNDSVLFDYFIRTHENGQVYDTLRVYKKITGMNRAISVPAGKFNCIEITQIMYNTGGEQNTAFKIIEYYEPGIGKIKGLLFNLDSKGIIELAVMHELIEYKLIF